MPKVINFSQSVMCSLTCALLEHVCRRVGWCCDLRWLFQRICKHERRSEVRLSTSCQAECYNLSFACRNACYAGNQRVWQTRRHTAFKKAEMHTLRSVALCPLTPGWHIAVGWGQRTEWGWMFTPDKQDIHHHDWGHR